MMNRRIGNRHAVDVRNVSWLPQQHRRKQFRLRKATPLTGRLVDLSFTGASVIAPRGISVGERVTIAVGNRRGIVAVRRSTPIAGSPFERYGVEFLALDDGLKDLIARTLDAHVRENEWRWAIAR